MNVSEHNLNAQSYLDDSFAEMNSLQNEITWHWGGEYVKAEKVCYRKRSSEVLAYKSIYSYPSMLGFVKSFCGISDFFLKILPFQSKFPLTHALMSCKAIYF